MARGAAADIVAVFEAGSRTLETIPVREGTVWATGVVRDDLVEPTFIGMFIFFKPFYAEQIFYQLAFHKCPGHTGRVRNNDTMYFWSAHYNYAMKGSPWPGPYSIRIQRSTVTCVLIQKAS